MTRFLGAVWEFLVGDDWLLALGVVLALGVTALLAAADLGAWWAAPLLVPLFLLASVRRALGPRR